MLLGKRPRPRPPIKRTTSLSEITFDLDVDAISSSSSTDTSPSPSPTSYDPFSPAAATHNQLGYGGGHQFPQRSPRNYNRRASADFLETAQFLRSCFLCNRCLVPTRDIYIYKGDSAFCSLECRQEQMSKDEKREKWSAAMASKKDVVAVPSSSAATDHVSTTTNTNGEIATVAAV